jgi:hypothetical protein
MAKRKRNHQLGEDVNLLRTVRREAHFAAGGSLTAWRGGNAITIPNKKREADRKACRKRVFD